MTTTSETGADQPATAPDTRADTAADGPPGTLGGSVLDLASARRRTTSPDNQPDTDEDTSPDTTRVSAADTATDTRPDTTPDTDTDAPGRVVLVDPPNLPDTTWLDRVAGGKRRAILPEWAHSVEQFQQTTRMVVSHYTHALAFHAVRTPFYAATVAFWSPRGATRLVGSVVRWVADAEGQPLRDAAARKEDAEQYLRLSRQRDSRVRSRAAMTVLGSLASMAAGLFVLLAAPPVAMFGVLAASVAVFGWRGAPADKPVLGPAVLTPKHTKLTSDIVLRALGALGIAEINKAMSKGGHGISFTAPISQDGPGWRAELDLPYGVTVTDVIERRDRLASGLRRPLGCVWPEPVHEEHTGRLVLWVGREDMNKAKQPPWPLARAGRADLFKAVPFGADQRGRLVSVLLMFTSVLIGAMPRQGKTFAMRVLMLAAALDPLVELRTYELKGTGDLSAVAQCSHDYVSGPDDEAILATLCGLREVYNDLPRRAKVIAGLPKHECPENKVTPELSARRSLGLHPVVIGIDECQELFAHPTYGKEAAELATGIIKRGPALGVILVLATQRPDKDSLPTGVSANVGTRLCLRVMGQVENDMVLGTSAYRNGIRATTFTNRDKGIGYLIGAADDPQIVRSAYLDGPAADRIGARARAAREAAGTLSGHAAGQPTAADVTALGPDLLDDIAAVVPAGEGKVWNEVVIARLADYKPDLYATWRDEKGWRSELLTNALKPHGIDTDQISRRVEGKQLNRRGIDRDHISTAVTERDERRRSR